MNTRSINSDDKSECFYPGKELEAMSFAINYHRWIAAEFKPYLGQIVAEVGAGIGDFSRILLENSLERLHVYEPSQNLFSLLKKRIGQEAHVLLFDEFFGADHSHHDYYDSVAYVNVLEHIENDKTELTNAHLAIKSGGHLLLFVPALSWLYSNFDKHIGHFRRYEKRDLVSLVECTGFSIIKVRYFDIAGIVPWFINFVLLKSTLGSGSVTLYDKYVVPIMRTLEHPVSPPLGKNILLVARKI
jgi:hypothetical protein